MWAKLCAPGTGEMVKCKKLSLVILPALSSPEQLKHRMVGFKNSCLARLYCSVGNRSLNLLQIS